MDISLNLFCEEGPNPRASFLFRDLTAPPPTDEGKERHGKAWTLKLTDQQVKLIDDKGDAVLSVARQVAESVIRIPFRSWDPEKIANLGIADMNGDYYWFDPQPETIQQIKQYLNLTILLRGPEAFAEEQGKAWGDFLAGCVALVISIALALGVAVMSLALTQWLSVGGTAVIGVGFVTIGVGMFAYGIRSLLRFRELSNLRAQQLGREI